MVKLRNVFKRIIYCMKILFENKKKAYSFIHNEFLKTFQAIIKIKQEPLDVKDK